jgi:pimeloyl-ACP methyl ester carboxylesterase
MRNPSSASALLALALFFSLHGGFDATAAEPEAEPDVATIVAEDGRVDWDDVLVELARLGHLDAAALRSEMPHGDVRLDSLRTRLALKLATAASGGALQCRVIAHGSGEPALRIELDRDRLRRSARRAEKLLRLDSSEEAESAWGLDPRPDAIDQDDEPLVVLVHGFNADARSLRAIRAALEGEGFECAVFAYANDGPIDEAAKLLSEELRELREATAGRPVQIVAHSMGGLVARAVIENPELNPGTVQQLVMIAPPNHGSNVAWAPVSLDLWEHRQFGEDSDWDSVLSDGIEDGFGEAKRDLRPGSPFLTRLNARPRNPAVGYSILLGNNGPLSDTELARLQQCWERACQRSRTAAFVAPRVDPVLSGSELLEGSGDGAVSVESGRLKGVKDVEVLPFRHNVLGREFETESGRRLLAEVIERLKS